MRSASSSIIRGRCCLAICWKYIVKSRLVIAFSRPPSAAICRENSPGPTLGVPLNIMCSSIWATPVVPLTSSIPPTRYQT